MSEQENNNRDERVTRQTLKDEADRLVGMLRGDTSADRRKAAIELGRLAIRMRDASHTRGSIESSQENQFPGDYQAYLRAAKLALQDPNPDVRREVAYILGEWGDDAAVDVVWRAVFPGEGNSRDPETSVRTAATRALSRIGGKEALRILKGLVTEDPNEDVRFNAVSGLASLAMREQKWLEKREQKRVEKKPPSGRPARMGAAVRARAGHIKIEGDEIKKILNILEQARSEGSWYVRERAQEALTALGQ